MQIPQIPQAPPTPETEASARRWTYRGVIALMVFGFMAFVAWQWRSGVQLTSVEVRDSCESSWFRSTPGCEAIRADREAIAELVAIAPGAPLYELDPREVAERVSQHPWVSSVDVALTPTGKLIIEVEPREARLLAMQGGRPAYYVDADGHRMPFVGGVAYHVPLLYGLQAAYREMEPVKDDRVRHLAALLPALDPQIDALISEIEFRGGGKTVIHTTPADHIPSLEVLIDFDDLESQLTALQAYWNQVLLASPPKEIHQIDLRFNSRIITR